MKIKEKKQIKALEKHGKQLVKYNNEKESSAHSKQKEIYEEIVTKRLKEIQDLSKQIGFNNLTYRYNGNNDSKTFIGYKYPPGFHWNIKES